MSASTKPIDVASGNKVPGVKVSTPDAGGFYNRSTASGMFCVVVSIREHPDDLRRLQSTSCNGQYQKRQIEDQVFPVHQPVQSGCSR
ncbi:hypothetical protein [Serratia ficaria]|uniref:hypothetical protein n=1 Tax=Serratia ficaria TaxID=61651 RepID=UPI0021B7B97C|nr:hypothetical protein [Serratia ficaria]